MVAQLIEPHNACSKVIDASPSATSDGPVGGSRRGRTGGGVLIVTGGGGSPALAAFNSSRRCSLSVLSSASDGVPLEACDFPLPFAPALPLPLALSPVVSLLLVVGEAFNFSAYAQSTRRSKGGVVENVRRQQKQAGAPHVDCCFWAALQSPQLQRRAFAPLPHFAPPLPPW